LQGSHKNEASLLKNCYINSLKQAEQHGLKSLAFPNISTGVYHFPKNKAAEIAIDATHFFLSTHYLPTEIIFACYDEEN
jgi:O-acetyl-ADP-ribose deacetylase (regulator of RNase III)